MMTQKSYFILGMTLHLGLLGTGLIFAPSKLVIPIPVTFSKFDFNSGGAVAASVEKTESAVDKKKITKSAPAVKNNSLISPPQAASQEVTGEGSATGNGTGDGIGPGSGNGTSDPIKAYGSQVARMINQQKTYPTRARRFGHEGLVLLQITLDRKGNLVKFELLKKTPFDSLNNAAVEMIKAVSHYPPLPNNLNFSEISFNVPIEYKLN